MKHLLHFYGIEPRSSKIIFIFLNFSKFIFKTTSQDAIHIINPQKSNPNPLLISPSSHKQQASSSSPFIHNLPALAFKFQNYHKKERARERNKNR
jgi:hypothetical protein